MITTYNVYRGLNCFPPNSYVEAMTPRTPECFLIRRMRLYRGEQVKARSLGWALIQHEWCPCEKGTFGNRDRHSRKTMCRDAGRRRLLQAEERGLE